MRHFILVIFIFGATTVWAAEDTPVAAHGPVMTDNAQDAQARDTGEHAGKKEYRSKYHTVKEETDTVKRALDVFKKKGKRSSLYKKRVWIHDTLQEDNASFLSFMTNDQNEGIVFSPDEDFVYYIEVTPGGRRSLKGLKIGSKEDFFVDEAVGRYFIETCEASKVSYLVVLDGKEVEGYHVYDLEGRPLVLPDMPADVNDLKNMICY